MASSNTTGWTWDTGRSEYCYWAAHEGCWVYASGTRLFPVQEAEQSNAAVRSSGPDVTSVQGRNLSGDGSQGDDYSLSSTLYGLSVNSLSVAADDQIPPQDLMKRRRRNAVVPATVYGAYGFNTDHDQRAFGSLPNVPREGFTDPSLLQEGNMARKKLKGTSEDTETLVPRYRVRKHARQFFVVGKVFRVLWPELAGDDTADSMTECTGHWGQSIYTKIRWFVVIRAGKFDCACLPIQTYAGRGVAKKNLTKNDHAIIYTGSQEPQPKADELPHEGEYGMLASIRITPKSRSEKLDSMSRINFAKMYTIEHNVKVYNFGDVHDNFVDLLRHQWKYTLEREVDGGHEEAHSADGDDEANVENDLGYTSPPKATHELARSSAAGQCCPNCGSGFSNSATIRVSKERSAEGLPNQQKASTPPREDASGQLPRPNLPTGFATTTLSTKASTSAAFDRSFIEQDDRGRRKEFSSVTEGSVRLDKHTPSITSRKSLFHDSAIDVETIRSGMSGGKSQISSNPGRERTSQWTDGMASALVTVPEDAPVYAASSSSRSDSEEDAWTEITEPDSASDASDDGSQSDSVSFEGPAFVSEVAADERFVHPERWLDRLQNQEADIFMKLSIANWREGGAQALQLEVAVQLLETSIRSIEGMQASNYCGGSINAIVTQSGRDAVASLVRIDKSQIITSLECIAQERLPSLMGCLSAWGLNEVHDTVGSLDLEQGLRVAATVMARFLSFAVLSFAGAHLERFEEKYDLKVSENEISFGFGMIVRRRSLKCLDSYLHGRQAWVFEEVKNSCPSRRHDALYLSTTVEEFDRIWGPLWVTASSASIETQGPPRSILGLNVGLGYIVPWDRGSGEPEPHGQEIFSHYTDDRSGVENSSMFFLTVPLPSMRLLIGARSKLSKNKSCSMTRDSCTQKLRDQNALCYPGTSRRRKTREVQTVTLSLSAFGFVNTGYQEGYKIREGASFRESLLSIWTNDPLERNPAIVLKKIGLEVSGCTENARRRRLRHILASNTMQTHLAGLSLDWNDECEKEYFSAMGGHDTNAFVKIYHEKKEWRRYWSEAICVSLKVLKVTGPDDDQRLSGLWCPNSRETYVAKLSPRRWAGLVKDTLTSCALVIMTNDCLGFKKDWFWAGNCSSKSDKPAQTVYQLPTVLETALLINKSCQIPKGLIEREDSWEITRLVYEDLFDLGDSGCLKVVRSFRYSRTSPRGVVLRWTTPNMGRETFEKMRERVLKKNRSPCHCEEIEVQELEKTSILVHVTSSGG